MSKAETEKIRRALTECPEKLKNCTKEFSQFQKKLSKVIKLACFYAEEAAEKADTINSALKNNKSYKLKSNIMELCPGLKNSKDIKFSTDPDEDESEGPAVPPPAADSHAYPLHTADNPATPVAHIQQQSQKALLHLHPQKCMQKRLETSLCLMKIFDYENPECQIKRSGYVESTLLKPPLQIQLEQFTGCLLHPRFCALLARR